MKKGYHLLSIHVDSFLHVFQEITEFFTLDLSKRFFNAGPNATKFPFNIPPTFTTRYDVMMIDEYLYSVFKRYLLAQAEAQPLETEHLIFYFFLIIIIILKK